MTSYFYRSYKQEFLTEAVFEEAHQNDGQIKYDMS